MNRTRSITLYALLAAVTIALLIGVRGVGGALDRQVAEHNLRFTGQVENASPVVSFTTIALGSFRGLVADLLWMRAGALQDEGNYFEMVQLARWITDLQPTFSGATAYLAWNMAYNISVTCSSFEDRWRWVNEGIKLIRDQAIAYNPEDPVLYKELSWIFQHKLGNIMDDANLYYKNQLAIQLDRQVGDNPDWTALAAAPASEKAFMAAYPADHELWKLGYSDYKLLTAAFDQAASPAPPANFAPGRVELKQQLTNYFRAEKLRRTLKLDPARIVSLNARYGALDWRVPESQAIYWASLGLERVPGHTDISCSRIITQALQDCFRAGRILMLDGSDFASIMVVPNVNVVDAAYQAYIDAQKEYDPESFNSSFRSARINFTKDAVVKLYIFGKFTKAEEYYRKLASEDGPQPGGGSVEGFVMHEFGMTIKDATVESASSIVVGLINQSIIYMLYHDQDAAVANERLARYVHTRYSSDMGNTARTRLPSYAEMKKGVVTSIIANFEKSGRAQLAARLKAMLGEEQLSLEAEKQRQGVAEEGETK
ncbi:MAG: hypothetical protein PHI35_09730 [Victivallaceae bacterium]|nr:hypothetical protein [Victivallaceae bacterium]